jgi:hypothetical protein
MQNCLVWDRLYLSPTLRARLEIKIRIQDYGIRDMSVQGSRFSVEPRWSAENPE